MFRIARWVSLIVALTVTTALRADTLYVGSGGGNPVAYSGVKVLRVTAGQVVYISQAGVESHKPIEQIVRMELEDEPALNSAEQAMAAKKWDDAVDAYSRAMQATAKQWVKDWASVRLLSAAQKSSRFDAASSAYITMLQRDPITAAKLKPQLPPASSSYLDTAINQVNTALAKHDITDPQKIALLGFLIDLERAKKDRAAEDRAATMLDEILAKDPNNPAAISAMARRKLTTAQRELDAKDYAKAAADIESSRAAFVDPGQQAEALFILAEAKYGTASDAASLKDAALAYMRVVANFKDLPDHPHVPQSLLKTAMIEEQLNDPATAAMVYQQIVQQYPDDPAARQAAMKLKQK